MNTRTLFLLAVALVAPVFAAPITECPAATAAVYQALTSGCSEGLFTLKGFSWSNTGNKEAAPGDVTLQPSSSIGLDFLSPTAFTVSGNDHIRVLFRYSIDPPPIIRGFGISIEPSLALAAARAPSLLALPAIATIDADICAGGFFSPGGGCPTGGGHSLSVQLNSLGEGVLDSRITFDEAVSIVDVSVILDMRGNGATAPFRISGASTGVTELTPEPGAFTLALTGLTALLLAQRRRLTRRGRKSG
jgi:hypothetical protein